MRFSILGSMMPVDWDNRVALLRPLCPVLWADPARFRFRLPSPRTRNRLKALRQVFIFWEAMNRHEERLGRIWGTSENANGDRLVRLDAMGTTRRLQSSVEWDMMAG